MRIGDCNCVLSRSAIAQSGATCLLLGDIIQSTSVFFADHTDTFSAQSSLLEWKFFLAPWTRCKLYKSQLCPPFSRLPCHAGSRNYVCSLGLLMPIVVLTLLRRLSLWKYYGIPLVKSKLSQCFFNPLCLPNRVKGVYMSQIQMRWFVRILQPKSGKHTNFLAILRKRGFLL